MLSRFLALVAVICSVGLLAEGDAEARPTGGYKNIRTTDGRINALDLYVDKQSAGITIEDGTGVTLTTPTTATVLTSATLTLVDATIQRGTVVGLANGATLTINQPGLYTTRYCLGDGAGANTATVTAEPFRKDGAGSAAALGEGSRATAITLTAQPWIPLCGSAYFTVTQAQATATVVIDLRVTASTGNLTVKRGHWEVFKIDELQPATP